jgi:calnexin
VPNPKCEDVAGCGPWTQPKIRNPDYKVGWAVLVLLEATADKQGKWTVPKIPNPEYKGVWTPRLIPNPQFFEDKSPADFTKIGGIGIELWTMTEDILCELRGERVAWRVRGIGRGTVVRAGARAHTTVDNIYVGHSAADAKKFAAETYHVKKAIEKEAEGAYEDDEEPATTLVEKVQLKVNEFIREYHRV